jgi:hypothetical protein
MEHVLLLLRINSIREISIKINLFQKIKEFLLTLWEYIGAVSKMEKQMAKAILLLPMGKGSMKEPGRMEI